jgi:hypothetical protein
MTYHFNLVLKDFFKVNIYDFINLSEPGIVMIRMENKKEINKKKYPVMSFLNNLLPKWKIRLTIGKPYLKNYVHVNICENGIIKFILCKEDFNEYDKFIEELISLLNEIYHNAMIFYENEEHQMDSVFNPIELNKLTCVHVYYNKTNKNFVRENINLN